MTEPKKRELEQTIEQIYRSKAELRFPDLRLNLPSVKAKNERWENYRDLTYIPKALQNKPIAELAIAAEVQLDSRRSEKAELRWRDGMWRFYPIEEISEIDPELIEPTGEFSDWFIFAWRLREWSPNFGWTLAELLGEGA
jgi:hypothetical protein